MTTEQQSALVDTILNEWDNDDVEVGMLPSSHQLNERVIVFMVPEGEETFPGIRAKVRGVHFFPGKVKYDVELFFYGGYSTRIYNVDAALVTKAPVSK